MEQSLPSYIGSMMRYVSGALAKSQLTTTRWGDSYRDQKVKCLQALTWWATDLTLRGKYIVLAGFDATMTEDFIDETNLDYEDGKKEPDIKKPDKFSHIKWLAWE